MAADGSRAAGPAGERLAEEARAAAQEVDWDCDLRTLVHDRNLGCKNAVGSAVTWFFEHVDEGVILEDDCVPDPTFFAFCADLLERYGEDERVSGIAGSSFRAAGATGEVSYAFAAHTIVWGWATWRRAWAHYDSSLSRWPQLRETGWLEGLLRDRASARFWRAVFDRDHRGEIDTWDFAWTFACWVQYGLTAHPAANLITNIGFDDRAVHTRNPASPLAAVPARAIGFPLVHPPDVVRDYELDRFIAEHVHQARLRTSRSRRVALRLRQIRLSSLRAPGYRARRERRADS